MNKKRVCVVLVLMVCRAGGQGLAQQKAPPPPKPPGDGPTLEVTMKFIQEKVNGLGPVNFVSYNHENVTGQDWASQYKVEISKVDATPSTCSIRFHVHETQNGKDTQEMDAGIPLKTVESIVVMPMEQELKEVSTVAGHPAWNSKVEPPIFALKAIRSGKSFNFLHFTDEDLANRVAKAMVHAVELCGGGRKEPF